VRTLAQSGEGSDFVNVRDVVHVAVSEQTAQALYPQPRVPKQGRRVLGHEVVREVHSARDLHDVPEPAALLATHVLERRYRRRVYVVREPSSRRGVTVLVTNG
jgi:hypothetical protein